MPENSPLGLPSSDDLDRVVNDKETTPLLTVREFPPVESLVVSSLPTVTTVNNNVPGKCFRCGGEAINFCRHCGQEFCAEHKSKYATATCYLCIAANNLGIDYEELVEEEPDENGVMHTHRGRRIKLIGEGWPNAMQMIETMTDEGLEIFIAERQRLLAEAVKLGEYHRITLSAAVFKKEYNRKSKIAKLRRRVEELKQGTIRLQGKALNMGGRKGKTPDEKLAASLGLTMEQFAKFKKLVAKP